MGLDTKSKSIGVPQTKILEFSFSFSTSGHFSSRSQLHLYFTGNMWNLNQMSPLNKMIPLAEVMGVHWGLSEPVNKGGFIQINIYLFIVYRCHTQSWNELISLHFEIIVKNPEYNGLGTVIV